MDLNFKSSVHGSHGRGVFNSIFLPLISIRRCIWELAARHPSIAFTHVFPGDTSGMPPEQFLHELNDGHGLFVEYHSDGFLRGTERNYAQDYVSLLVEENGKIKLLREYMNVISTARILLPKGLAGVPEP